MHVLIINNTMVWGQNFDITFENYKKLHECDGRNVIRIRIHKNGISISFHGYCTIVKGHCRVEIYIHLLDLTRKRSEKCNFRSLAGIEPAALGLNRAMHRNRTTAGSIPARDLKLHFSLLFLVRSNKFI